MGISAATQLASHSAETNAVKGKNNAKLKNWHREVNEHNAVANLDNVKYLSDVQEQDAEQDATYQAMMDQWSDTDAQLKSIFAKQDFAIEDAIIKMHEEGYAGSQTGASAARLAGKSAIKAGRAKARAIHSKMFAVDEANRTKSNIHKRAKYDSHKLFMEVAFAPTHGFSPARPEFEAGPSKAGLILGLAKTGMAGAQAFDANTAPGVTLKDKKTAW